MGEILDRLLQAGCGSTPRQGQWPVSLRSSRPIQNIEFALRTAACVFRVRGEWPFPFFAGDRSGSAAAYHFQELNVGKQSEPVLQAKKCQATLRPAAVD